MNKSKNITSLDVMRILAIFLVLMNHQPAYKLYYHESSFCEILTLIEAIIIRINVPLFAMISGALLLGREECLGTVWKKRISRILWVILLFSGLLYLELGWLRNRNVTPDEFLYGLFAGNLKNLTSYWFLYAYLGFLLMLPFLRKIARSMTSQEFLWILGLHVIVSTIIPISSFVIQLCGYKALVLSSSMNMALATAPLFFYPLIGYYLHTNIDVDTITAKQWKLIGTVCAGCIAVTAGVVYAEGKTKGFSQSYLDLFSYVNTIVAFLVIKRVFNYIFTMKHSKASSVLSFMASLVFGVYLLDLAVQLPVWEDMRRTLVPAIGKFGFSITWCLTSFILGGTLTYILKHVPFLKKLL